MKRVLVLLIGEVLEDPRVLRTCMSLAGSGADVTVACTNPSNRPVNESAHGFTIVRFRHRKESPVKRMYNWLKGRLRPSLGGALGRGHEDVPSSTVAARLRNIAIGLNYRHFARENARINRAMTTAFDGGRFDLVHCNDYDTLVAGCALKRSGVAASMLYDSHEYWPGIGVDGSASNDAIRAAEKTGIAYADFVVTVNPLIAERMCDEHGLGLLPAVVMNCPYMADAAPGIDTVHDPVRVIYQGKLQAFRGLDELVAAFTDIEGATLTLSGYGPLEESLRKLALSLGINDRVTFSGRYAPAETLSILDGHDIGVMPFRGVTDNIRLSSPNKLFDYTMAGLALAAGDLPFLKSVVLGHDTGLLFNEISPSGIAETLNAMTSDRESLARFRKNARRAAEDAFSWERQFAHYPWKP